MAVTGLPPESVDFRKRVIGGSGSLLCYDLNFPTVTTRHAMSPTVAPQAAVAAQVSIMLHHRPAQGQALIWRQLLRASAKRTHGGDAVQPFRIVGTHGQSGGFLGHTLWRSRNDRIKSAASACLYAAVTTLPTTRVPSAQWPLPERLGVSDIARSFFRRLRDATSEPHIPHAFSSAVLAAYDDACPARDGPG
jgi:predicted amidohydrolase